jgi:hypothetical protein
MHRKVEIGGGETCTGNAQQVEDGPEMTRKTRKQRHHFANRHFKTVILKLQKTKEPGIRWKTMED